MENDLLREQSKKQMERMLEGATKTGAYTFSEEQKNRFLQNSEGAGEADEALREEEREQLKQMFMTDTSARDVLKQQYPKLAQETMTEEETLRAQASVSGMKKVKTDFLGKKKRAANRRLRTIDANRKLLRDQRDAESGPLFLEKKKELQDRLEKRVHNLQREIDYTKEKIAKATQKETIDKLKKELANLEKRLDYASSHANNNPVTLANCLKDSDDDARIKRVAVMKDVLDNTKVIFADGASSKFQENKITRDAAFLITEYGKSGECTKEGVKECCRYDHIVRQKCDIDGKPASKELRKEALNYFKGHAERWYEEVLHYQKQTPALFVNGEPDQKEIIAHLEEFKPWYSILQPAKSAFEEVMGMPEFKELPEEEKKLFAEHAAITASTMSLMGVYNSYFRYQEDRAPSGEKLSAQERKYTVEGANYGNILKDQKETYKDKFGV